MFDRCSAATPDAPAERAPGPLPTAPTIDDLQDAIASLAAVNGADADEAGLIEHLTALEELKGAAAAAQARVTMALVRAREHREAEQGMPANRRGQGLAAEIALARRSSPHRGARDLGLAKALVQEMPHTLTALTRGKISEWRATLLVRETAVLSREHRRQVDDELAGRLTDLGDRAAAAEARKIGYGSTPGRLFAVPAARRPTATSASARHPTP